MTNRPLSSFLLCCIAGVLLLTGGCASLRAEKPAGQADYQTPSEAVSAASQDDDTRYQQSYILAPREYAPKPVSEELLYSDLWDRIRDGYGLPDVDSPYVAEYERWFASRPEYIARLVERASPYLYHIVVQVEQRGMPMEIALLPAIESAFKPHALSHASAVGLWQFIPSTGRLYGLKQNWWYDGRKDVYASTESALDYLQKLHRDFDGDWALALAGYNAGEGTVSRAIKHNRKHGKPTHYTALKLRSETRRYVPKLVAFSKIIRNPQKYGIQLAAVPNTPYFSVVRLNSQIDLGVVADASPVNLQTLTMLNPGFRRWATDPDGPHRLLVPVDHAESVADAIAGIPQHQRVRWAHYRVRKGDSLSTIARRHGVSVNSLRSTNNIRGSMIRVNQDLLIPVSSSSRAVTQRPVMTASLDNRAGSSSSKPARQSKPLVVSVRKGDTLWSLARRYDVSLNQLAQWNQIQVGDLLHLGQKIKIWQY
jgi:membrane-bound lytic murein transglycosylase D